MYLRKIIIITSLIISNCIFFYLGFVELGKTKGHVNYFFFVLIYFSWTFPILIYILTSKFKKIFLISATQCSLIFFYIFLGYIVKYNRIPPYNIDYMFFLSVIMIVILLVFGFIHVIKYFHYRNYNTLRYKIKNQKYRIVISFFILLFFNIGLFVVLYNEYVQDNEFIGFNPYTGEITRIYETEIIKKGLILSLSTPFLLSFIVSKYNVLENYIILALNSTVITFVLLFILSFDPYYNKNIFKIQTFLQKFLILFFTSSIIYELLKKNTFFKFPKN